MDILIADDDYQLACLWERAFTRAGFAVHVVYDGNDAMDYLLNNPLPNAILVDQMMPGLKGTDVLVALSSMEGSEAVRTILVTASPESIPADIYNYADIFLQKPVSYRDLVMLAGRMIARA